ncbi:MAG: flagellar biosynthesis anti-sigma factor FlgM [Phycisphaeraceae bacterium]|nr:flagellar biosynthesis anti-sigma factor FlgM [Phycisphaeraceae bacterium]MCB9847005.1 flagellar biosynthesis anti-sigma factor FlgM [Phycisphaeraceae bacterium]
MEITQVNPISTRPVTGASSAAARSAAEAPRIGRQPDQVELSDRAVLLSRLRELPAVRQDLINQVRAAIERGEYDTPEKFDAAVEKLIAEQTEGL